MCTFNYWYKLLIWKASCTMSHNATTSLWCFKRPLMTTWFIHIFIVFTFTMQHMFYWVHLNIVFKHIQYLPVQHLKPRWQCANQSDNRFSYDKPSLEMQYLQNQLSDCFKIWYRGKHQKVHTTNCQWLDKHPNCIRDEHFLYPPILWNLNISMNNCLIDLKLCTDVQSQ